MVILVNPRRTQKMGDWKHIKRTGGIRRKINQELERIINKTNTQVVNSVLPDTTPSVASASRPSATIEVAPQGSVDFPPDNVSHSTDIVEKTADRCSSESEEKPRSEFTANKVFRENIRKWATERRINQEALRELTQIINERLPNSLPRDPRTILKTARYVPIKSIPGGEYWHNGLTKSLLEISRLWPDMPDTISLNINMDGLPIHKSSKHEFWPILGNIYEEPRLISPFIIGIYYGVGKPADITVYLEDFVTEMATLIENGLTDQDKNKTFTVKIRCFICDSPARAYIKGKLR